VVLVAALALGNLAGLVYVAGKLAPGRPLWNSVAVDRSIRESTGGVTVPWVDRANQTHTRDALFIGALERVVDRLLEQKPRVTIMSGQAGMVMYYVASRYYGKVDFIDRHALTSRQLVEPGRALGLPMLSTGLEISVPQFFQIAARHPELTPDIVFDLNRQRRDAAVQNGYTCVYEQMGTTGASQPSWFTVRGNVYQFIAVPNARVDAVMQGETPPRVFRWNHEP
jgi:hypothetical protein